MAAKPLGEEKGPAAGRRTSPARIAAVGALAAIVIVLVIVLISGGGGHKYTLIFQNAGQLVPDNQVLVGGSPVGTVESIDLTDNNLAAVHVEVEQELHEGTTATIRATSLSGVANHYVSISPGPNSSPALDEGSELGLASTTTPVDIDQFFNTFPPPVRQGLRHFIEGNAEIYAGQGEAANEAYKYFGTALNRTGAFVGELNADEALLARFISSASRLTTAVAGRGEQLSSAVNNANHAFESIASENVALDQSLERLPPVFRQSNTTFVNLRAALDDLEPLVNTAKPATKELAPFLAELRPIFQKLVPFTEYLHEATDKPGPANDTIDLLKLLPSVEQRISKTFPHAEKSVADFQPNLNFIRAYTPDLFNAIGKIGQVTGFYDGNGHYARTDVAMANLFANEGGTLKPITKGEQMNAFGGSAPVRRRCPGGATQSAAGRLQPVRRRRQRQQLRMQPRRRTPRRMIRRLLPVVILAAIVVGIVLLVSGGSSGGGYQVRAIFDNGAFMVSGEQVRVAGANVGTIESVSVSRPGEVVAYKDGKPVSVPGKAILVMDIADPGFQDFRADASCQIRPQSLIGERYVDCRPTLPRAPGSPPAPALKKVESGPGKGQYLLPLGNNGTSVDPDLINDINTLPYAQRFRLIFNELGATLAGRGEDLKVLIKRANPVLRDVDTLFGILSAQRKQLSQLAADSEEVLRPLAREREHVAGFFANAGTAAQASSEHGAEVEESLQKFPTFLTEFKKTMYSLKGFSDAARPVFEEFGRAAPSLTDATRTLTPFSEATTVALKSLGKAGEESGPLFEQATPVVRKAATLAKTGAPSTSELAKLLVSLRKTGGWDGLTELIYNTAASTNGFDQYGHFGRTYAALTVCNEYIAGPGGYSGGGCTARFHGPHASEEASTSAAYVRRVLSELEAETGEEAGGTTAETGAKRGPTTNLGQSESTEGETGLGRASATGGTAPLIDYLLGP